MRFGPGDVVNTVGSVEGDEFRESGSARREVEYVETAVSEDAEVLGSGDGEARLVEGREFDRVAIERRFKNRHGGVCVSEYLI